MSTSGMTYAEISEAVTGFDELAVEKHMEIDIYTQGEQRPVWMLRALVFVHQRHQGVDDTAAKQTALSLPLSAVNDYFDQPPTEDDDDDETDPAGRPLPDPETASGKGASLLDDTPSGEPISV